MRKILTALFLSILSVGLAFPQGQGLKVSSGYRDFKVKITKCEADGATVFIDMLWENVSDKDLQLGFNAFNWIFVYDDEGNRLGDGKGNIILKVGGEAMGYTSLPPEVPVKAILEVTGVPESANMLRLVDIYWTSSTLGTTWTGGESQKRIKLQNVPISREGDD